MVICAWWKIVFFSKLKYMIKQPIIGRWNPVARPVRVRLPNSSQLALLFSARFFCLLNSSTTTREISTGSDSYLCSPLAHSPSFFSSVSIIIDLPFPFFSSKKPRGKRKLFPAFSFQIRKNPSIARLGCSYSLPLSLFLSLK